MQRTVRALRIALPILFFLFLGVLVFNWRHNKPARDKVASEPVVVTRTGEKAQAEFKGFEDTQTIGGRLVSRIRARRAVAYTSNWNTLEDVALTIYRPNGLTYDLVCPQAQFNSATKHADAKGGVTVTSSDGVVIKTAEINFDGNRLTNHIPVDFKIDRWTGNGGALDLDVEAETLRLFEKLTATMAPEKPGDAPMNLASQDGVFRRKENDVTFTQNVVMTRLADRFNSDTMVGRFTQDHHTLLALDGNGHVFISMSGAASPGEDLGGKKDITCDHFYTDVGPDGTITGVNAVGDTAPAHAVIDGPPKRDIVAKNFRVKMAGKAIQQLKCEFGVVMKELAEVTREVDADVVTVAFDMATHKPASAFLDGGVKYHDPTTQATAVRANYDIIGDRVVMTATPGFDPTVTTDGNVLKAKQIEFSPKGQTAKATGSVIAQLASKSGASADSTNIFPAGKPVFVNSDNVTMRQLNRVAVFSGNVRAWQDINTLFAQELQVQGAGDSITARGNVRTVLYNTSGEQRKTAMTSRSDQLMARKTERRLDLSGAVKMDDEGRTLTSEKSAFFFDANKKIERVEAEKNVVMIETAANRKATGDRMVYQVAKRIADIWGNPATVTAPNGNFAGPQINVDMAHNKVEVISVGAPTKGTYKPQP
jgi:lipopolysaccharide export system protein LptA